ncbi:MAG: leucine-rich repeat domain-containing protein [Ruminococcus sp.]|nr:leucine-rich repeat domain-containing protein [Ruminococcus sp.]
MYDFVSSSYSDEDKETPFYKFRSFIKSVVVEEGVTSIGEYAFYNLNNVSSMSLPSTLTEIKKDAFYGVSALEELILPDGLETIGGYAFYDMKSLKKINIPDTVTSIENYAFYNCSSLESVSVASGNTSVKEEDGIIYDSSKTKILIYPECLPLEKYTVPSKVTRLPSSVFKNRNLRCLVVPKNVKNFSDSSYSNKISVKNSLERIAFLGDVPGKSYYYNEYLSISSDHPVTITYSFTGENWKETMEQCDDSNIIWEDKDALNFCNTLTIDGVPETVKADNAFALKAKLNPLLETMFNWSSDNEDIVSVGKNGLATVKCERTATILCSSSNGKYTCSIIINAESDENGESSFGMLSSYEYMELDEETVGKPFKSKQFPCEKLGGMYFVNGNLLSFYSFYSKQVEWQQSFNYLSDCYECGGKLYILDSNECQIFDLETWQITGRF